MKKQSFSTSVFINKFNWIVLLKLLSYFGSLMLALIVAVYREQISKSIKHFFDIDPYVKNVNSFIFLYLSIVLMWLIFLAFFYTWLNKKSDEKMTNAISEIKSEVHNSVKEMRSEVQNAIAEIRSSVYRAPNINIFTIYPIICNTVINHLRNAKLAIKEKKSTKEVYEIMFRDVLSSICDLISDFTNTNKQLFSADFMAFINVKDQDIINKLNGEPAYLHNHISPSFFIGVLTSIESLSYPSPRHDDRKMIIPILNERAIKLPQVTGPGSALLRKQCFIKDTADIFKEIGDEAKMGKMKHDIVNYYKKNRPQFKSFASFSLTFTDDSQEFDDNIATGVLNIYFKEENILGADTLFHNTFSAYIRPIAYTMAHELRKYIDLHKNEITI